MKKITGLKLIQQIIELQKIYNHTLDKFHNGNIEEKNVALELYNKFPELFPYLKIENDKNFANKYIIKLSFDEFFSELEDGQIGSIDFFLKENDEFSYNKKIIYHVKNVFNGEISNIYYDIEMEIINKKDCFLLDFLEQVFDLEIELTKQDLENLINLK